MTEPEPSDLLTELRAAAYTYPAWVRVLRRFARKTPQNYTLGFDASVWQAAVEFQFAKYAGMRFVFLRALYGTQGDAKFPQHWYGAEHVLPRAPYLYYRDDQDPLTQANLLYETCLQQGGVGTLPPVVDVESINNPTLTAAKIQACAARVDALFGDVMLYTGFYVWRDKVQGDKSWAAQYKLWLAGYPFAGWQHPQDLERVKLYPPLIPAPWTAFDVWQFTSKLPAAEYGASGTYLDGNYCTEAFATVYGLMPDPDPEPTGDPLMKFKTKTSYTIRNQPGNPANSKIGTIPASVEIVAEEIRFTDVNSAWVRINPSPAWLTDPNYTGPAWVAGLHDGQGPFLDTLPSVPCEGVPMTDEQLQRLVAVEALTATHETEINALQENPPAEFVPSHRVVTTKPGGEKLRAWPGGSEAVQVYHGQLLMMLNQTRGGQELMATQKGGVTITGWLDPANIGAL